MDISRIIEEAVVELITLRDMLRWSVSQFYSAKLFYGHGTDNAWDEAVTLCLHALHLPPNINPQVIDASLTAAERRKIAKLIMRRVKERIPAAYLVQEAWFAGLSFYVDQRVLIPRSPIAELIDHHFAPWTIEENVADILDLCTGSACIAIACALAFPEARVDAVDISADALDVAKMNVERHKVNDDVTLIQSDLFTSLPAKQYQIIVSNPPYVSAEEMVELPEEYQHEPTLALAAGQHGLDIVMKILQQAKKYLTEEGILIVEVGNSEIALKKLLPQVPFTWLDFERGGGGVFMLTAEQLAESEKYFA